MEKNVLDDTGARAETNNMLKSAAQLISKWKYLLLVLIFGAVLLLLPSRDDAAQTAQAEQQEAPAAAQEAFSLSALEEQLSSQLSKMEGAGRVSVVLTLERGEESLLARNSSRRDLDAQQSEESLEAVVVDADGGEQAVVVGSVYPKFRGALVLCQGADSSSVRLKLTEAVAAVTGLGADSISVIKMTKQ